MAILSQLRNAARKRAAYIRTRNELRALPLDLALDLNINTDEAPAIARRAVYGA